jgi:hypothetical protein
MNATAEALGSFEVYGKLLELYKCDGLIMAKHVDFRNISTHTHTHYT